MAFMSHVRLGYGGGPRYFLPNRIRGWTSAISLCSCRSTSSSSGVDEKSTSISEIERPVLPDDAVGKAHKYHPRDRYVHLNRQHFSHLVTAVRSDVLAASLIARDLGLKINLALCQTDEAAAFVLNLVKYLQRGRLSAHAQVCARVAAGASGVFRHNLALDHANRLVLGDFCRRTLDELSKDLSQSWSNSPLVELCLTASNVRNDVSAAQVDRLVAMLLSAPEVVPWEFTHCLECLLPLLTRRHRKLLLKQTEEINLQDLPQDHVQTLAVFYRRLPGIVPENAKEFLDYLLSNSEELDILVTAYLWEICTRWKLVQYRLQPRVAPWLRDYLHKRCKEMSVNSLVMFLLPVAELRQYDDLAADAWSKLALQFLPGIRLRCQGKNVDGVPVHHSLACKLLRLFIAFRACPDELFFAWSQICLRNAADMTFAEVSRVIQAINVHRLHSHFSNHDMWQSLRSDLLSAMFSLPNDVEWVDEDRIHRVSLFCTALESLKLHRPLPGKLVADWLLCKCTMADNVDWWPRVALSCANLGVPSEQLALACMAALESGVVIQPSQAVACAWLCGPLTNVLTLPLATQLLLVIARNMKWSRNSLTERLLTVCAWSGMSSDTPADPIVRSAAPLLLSSVAKSTQVLGQISRIVSKLQTDFGADVVGTGEAALVDFLPVPALMLYSQSQQQFVPLARHWQTWSKSSIVEKRSGDIRLICILPKFSNHFFLDELVSLASACHPDVVLRSHARLVSPQVQTYCRALVTLGAYNAVPICTNSQPFRLYQDTLASLILYAARSEPLFQPFCPPWEAPKRVALLEF